MPLLAVLPFAFAEAHIYPPCWSLMLLLFTPKQRLHIFLTSTWHAFPNQTLTLALSTIWVLFFWDNVFYGILEHSVIANILIAQMFIFCC